MHMWEPVLVLSPCITVHFCLLLLFFNLVLFVSSVGQIPGKGPAPAGLSWMLLERLTGEPEVYNHDNLEKVWDF